MKNEKEIILEREDDPLAKAAQLDNRFPFVAPIGTSTERRKNGLASRTSSSGSFEMRERRCSM